MSMHSQKITRIGIVGCGVIGGSWAAFYLAKGFDVVATDPAADAETRLRADVQSYWPLLEQMGLAEGASPDRLIFERDLAKAVQSCGFIQENGPERMDIKRGLIAAMDAAADPSVIIASSSSGIIVSDFQDAARHPERILLGHPFNPPHLIPLVEIVGGKLTSPEAIQQAINFYESLGKKPVHIRKEVKGHIANRLQAALIREAMHLLGEGVASAADIDAAVTYGPGLRWAILGPFMTMQLAGGAGGASHALEHLGPALELWWADLGKESAISPAVKERIVNEINDELSHYSLETMVEQRDELLMTLIARKAQSDQIP